MWPPVDLLLYGGGGTGIGVERERGGRERGRLQAK